jgi:hypothetical protein
MPMMCAGTYSTVLTTCRYFWRGENSSVSFKQVKQQSNPVMQIYVNLLRPLSVFKKICRTISAWWKTANSFHLFQVFV